MWAIKDKKSGQFIKELYRDDSLGVPDIHFTDDAGAAKIYKSRKEANNIIDRLNPYGTMNHLEVIKTWGRRPN